MGTDGIARQTERASPSGPVTEPAAMPDRVVEPTTVGRYQILFELASGGMGTVHAGRLVGAHEVERLVAIKRLKSEGGAAERDAFLREARLSAKIDHPNVVKTLELIESEGTLYLIMDLVQGVSLATLCETAAEAGEDLPPALVAWIGAQVARGLHAAHELRAPDGAAYELVHRDVSPENVLLSFDGRVFVADFGVAKNPRADRQTESGVVKGKFAYMSPEQTEAAALDRRSDLFALGVVLHEALTGRELFAGKSIADTVRRIWSLDPPDPRRERPEIPRALVALVLRCLARAREDRPADADEVARALRQVLRDEGEVVDEADLSELLARHFPGAREALLERIAEAIAEAEAPRGEAREVVGKAPPAISAEVAVAETVAASDTVARLPLERSRLPWLLVAAVLVLAAVGFALRGADGPPEAKGAATSEAASASPAIPSPSAPPSSSATPIPREEVSEEVKPEPAPSDPRHVEPPPRPAPPRPAPPSGPPPAPTPAPSSVKGVPFVDL